MLEVGNGGMSFDEYYAHFSLWCILKAPLLIGCALDRITDQTLTILGNTELIAINQDGLGKQGWRIRRDQNSTAFTEVWGGDLANSGFVVGFFNRGET
jgi:alpha-galactosidase